MPDERPTIKDDLSPGDILDLRCTRPPNTRAALMVVGVDGEPVMLGPVAGTAAKGALVLLAEELRAQFPERWPDRELLQMTLVAMHFARVRARHNAAGFDYPEGGSSLP